MADYLKSHIHNLLLLNKQTMIINLYYSIRLFQSKYKKLRADNCKYL